MIPDLVYLRPSTAEEAVQAWSQYAGQAKAAAKDVRYHGGGTELVTGARRSAQTPHVLIDVGRLEELRFGGVSGDRLELGAGLTLNEAGALPFPLMSATVRRIADQTTRNRVTLGGNVVGALPYREAVLPLLVADARVVTLLPGNPPQRRERSLRQAFDKKLALEPGELVVGFSLPLEAASRTGQHERATRTGPVDYPLVTAVFLEGTGVAVSGLFAYPLWFASLEQAREAATAPGAVKADQRSSAEYRRALFSAMLARVQEVRT